MPRKPNRDAENAQKTRKRRAQNKMAKGRPPGDVWSRSWQLTSWQIGSEDSGLLTSALNLARHFFICQFLDWNPIVGYLDLSGGHAANQAQEEG